MKRLFICATPLQALIIDKIIKLEKINEFDFVYISRSGHNDYLYFSRFIPRARYAHFIIVKSGYHKNWLINLVDSLWGHFKIRGLSMKLIKSYDIVYGESIFNGFVKALLGYLNYHHLYTIDDGGANLLMAEDPPKIALYIQFLLVILGGKKNINLISAQREGHYTIFQNKNQSNHIDLFPGISKNTFLATNKNLNIYIGQPLSEAGLLSPYSEYTTMKNAIQHFDISIYLKHPKEQKEILLSIKIVSPEIIAEEYIFKLMPDYQRIRLYGITSSVLLTMKNIIGVETFLIKNKNIPDKLLAQQKKMISHGVKFVNLD